MDELTLLRRLDADTPAPTEAALTEAFAALTERMTASEQRGRKHVPNRRRAVRLRRGALITAAAATLIVGLVLTDTIGLAGLRPGASAEAAEVLDRAARTTIRSIDPVLDTGQFLRVDFRSVHSAETATDAGDLVLYSIHEDHTTWIPADVRASWTEVRFPLRSAGQYWGKNAKEIADKDHPATTDRKPEVLHGKAGAFFGPIGTTPDSVDALPRDPRTLLNHIYRVTFGTGSSPDDEALVFIADTLRTGFADATLRAALYRAAALVPGVTLTADSATLNGTTGVAIGRLEPKYGIRQDLIIDPDTGTVIGDRRVATRELDGLIPAGTTIAWSSARTTVVDEIPARYRQ